MNKLKTLSEKVQEWKDVEGIKPCNNNALIETFILCLTEADVEDFMFDGDGAYFGKQVTWKVGLGYWWDADINLNFEIAYSKDEIRVYSGNNDGFWTPEYIRLEKSHKEFNKLYTCLHLKLTKVFGL